MPVVEINGQAVEAGPEETILAAARHAGIRIPALCYHPALKPAGACRLCVVEISESGKTRTALACVLKARDGLKVQTETPAVREARNDAFQKLLHLAPRAERILNLAHEFGIELPPQPDGCIRCRLCTRVCGEIVKAGALKIEKRNGTLFVVPVEGRCIGCGTCVNMCPTAAIRMEDHDGIRTIIIRDETIGRHELQRCEMCGKLFATAQFLKIVHERSSGHHPEFKEHHTWCPSCAKLFSPQIRSSERIKLV